jgi:hypothetical protein
VGLGVGASVWLVQRLGLPLWWVLFPPLVHAAWNGNSQSIALALVVLGGPLAAALAVGIKLYAAVPLLSRPRTLLFAAIALVVTLPLLPWQLYLDSGFGVSDHVQTAWNGSAWRIPLLIPPTLAALWILRSKGAEWLAVPAVWPATQFYYAAFALPALVGQPVIAAALALPLPLMTPAVVMGMALVKLWRDRRPLAGAAAAPAA